MILNPHQLDLTQPLRAQVCIVGAGAAGITLACELDGTGLSVLLLDAGPVDGRGEVSQDAYEGSSEGAHPTPRNFRRLGFGGTTAIWGGRCVPFDPIDFEPRDHVANSGWPIGYHEVARHYPKAMQYCDAGAFEFNAERAIAGGNSPVAGLADDSGIVVDQIERYSLPTHFGQRYRPKLVASTNVRVLGQTALLQLLRSADGQHIREAACRLLGRDGTPAGGPALRVQADHFVLATGGIETVRLLLASEREHGGLGNPHDNVGRYYTCHVENVVGSLRPIASVGAEPTRNALAFETTRDGVYARRKLLIAPDVQRRERVLNVAFRLHYPDVSDPSHGSAVLSAVYMAKRLLVPEHRRILQHGRGDGDLPRVQAAHLRNIALGLPGLVGFAADWVRRHTLASRKLPYVLVPNADGSHVLEFNAEQTPMRDSRIVLGGDLDASGLPRVHVQWRMGSEDVASISRACRLLRDRIAAGGLCTLEFDDAQLPELVAASIPLGGHHIGGTRMAASAQQGVVDSDCTVFGLANLHIASAAVFPTSSHANPTLTIVALAVRLAGHLQSELRPKLHAKPQTRVLPQGATA